MIDVVICTYKPRIDYFSMVLKALDGQTLSKDLWNLTIVNNSPTDFASMNFDLNWHTSARIIPEEKTGLTNARLKGINSTSGDYIVFVDDDNILEKDYLEQLCNLFKQHPSIGVFGSGDIQPIFEAEPKQWMKPYLGYLALRKIEKDYWANFRQIQHKPWGAGMCLKRELALVYSNSCMDNKIKLILDRCGGSLMSAGDLDIAFTALDMGQGIGVFKGLSIKHLIPQVRVQEKYLLDLIYGITYSDHLLYYLRNYFGNDHLKISFFGKIKNAFNKKIRKQFTINKYERKVQRVVDKAIKDANKFIKNNCLMA